MTKLFRAVAIPMMLGAGACVPMEQSTLSYSSKTTMGVGVSAGTQETPGLDVTIGFKEANIALVPVAVAKYCYKATAEQCQNVIYTMELVSGTKNDARESSPVQTRINEIDRDLRTLLDQEGPATRRISILKAQIELAEAADAAQADLAKLPTEAADEPAELQSQRAALTSKVGMRPAGMDIAGARNQLGQLEAADMVRSKSVAELQRDRSQLVLQLHANSNSGREDAYSVYGKFNGQARGANDGASLTAGKIFATGVAAQNLTEFATAAECLANVGFLAQMMPPDKHADRAALLATAGEVCRTEARSNR